MKITSGRHIRCQARLQKLVSEYVGGSAQLASDIGMTRALMRAAVDGERGISEELAAKIELVANKPDGWMDTE
jgi:plasmid maintenance system antidote protein VapI